MNDNVRLLQAKIPIETINKLDDYIKKEQPSCPGNMSRASVLTMLLNDFLDTVENVDAIPVR
jgi:hypothetical protein